MMHEIETFLGEVAKQFQSQCGTALIEVYKLGSLAHGGFSDFYSDIDVGLLLDCRDPPVLIDEWIVQAKATHPEYGKKLSIFWGNPEFSWGRLPMIDRLDLLDHGVPLLHGRKAEFRRPTAEEIHLEQRQSIERSWRSRLPDLSRLTRLEIKDRKPYIRALLYPARLIYTWDNLAVGSNDCAVEYLHAVRPDGINLGIIDAALACRRGASTAADVFALKPDFNALQAGAMKYIGKAE